MRTSAMFTAVVVAAMLAACASSQGVGDTGPDYTPPDGTDAGGGSGGSSGSSSGGGSGSSSGGGSGSGSSSGGSSGSSSGGGSGSGSGGAASDAGVVDDGGNYNTPTQCSSGKMWLLGDTASDQMHPGVACDTCHKVLGSATKFPFDVAGTVYPTAHEPDDCNGVAGAQVIITDSKGTDHTLAVNAAGNFYNLNYVLIGAISTPYTAKVVANGKVRPMIGPQTDGDCNSCHSEKGTQAAPGRIMMP